MLKRLARQLPPGLKSALKRVRDTAKGVVGARRLRRRLKGAVAPRIVVGTSGIFEPGWIPTDVEYLNLLRSGDWQNFFVEASVGAILAEHVWEHLTPEEGLLAARHCHRFLQPGGYLRLAVPDGGSPDPAYIQQVKVNGTGSGADDHKVLYTLATLTRLLEQAGFTVTPLEYFDDRGNFQYREWNPADGMVHRSRRFDERNRDGRLGYTSLIVDAVKR